MKRVVKMLVPLCLALMVVLSSCGENMAYFNAAPDQITSSVIRSLNIKNMTELNSEQIALRYPIDMTVLEDESVYISSINNNADEVAVFKLREHVKVAPVMSAVNDRVKQKLSSFERLNPTEYEKVKNAIAENIGSYIVVIICEDSEKAKETLNDLK